MRNGFRKKLGRLCVLFQAQMKLVDLVIKKPKDFLENHGKYVVPSS